MENATNYYRDLDIEQAIATTRFTVNHVTYTHEAFTSFTDQLLVIKLNTSQKEKSLFGTIYKSIQTNGHKEKVFHQIQELQLDGKTNDHEGIEGKVRFTALLE